MKSIETDTTAPPPSRRGRRASKGPRRVGRPRANPRKVTGKPEEEILIEAGRLFSRKGFHATSTREIAAAVGLRQPSLFHYYASKEAILEELLTFSLQKPLELAERIFREAQPASVRLYRLVRYDVHHLCASPYDLTALLESPELREERFQPWWRKRQRLIGIVEGLIREGQREGHFTEILDPGFAADLLLSIDDATVRWYQRRPRQPPAEVAEQIASFTLRALLHDPRKIDRVRGEAGPIEPGEAPPGPRARS